MIHVIARRFKEPTKQSHNVWRLLRLRLAMTLTVILMFFPSSLPCFAENKPVIRPKIGLALGGGGARGAAHIGILRAFEKENIPIDYLVGTSAGALIAALYSGGISPDEIEKYVLSGAIMKVYRTDISIVRALFSHINRVFHIFFGKPYYAGLYNDEKLHNFVDRVISKDNGSIEIAIPLNIIAVDLITGLPVVIKSGDVGLAVKASTAIPTLRQPVPIDDKLLVDGGILKNIPIDEAKKMGADLVIAVDVDEKTDISKPEDFKTIEGIITRVITLSLKAQSQHILDKADIVISPNLNEVGILDLDKKTLSRAIKAGEEAALKKIPEIKKKIEQKTQTLRIAKAI